jgi:uncharacterized protein
MTAPAIEQRSPVDVVRGLYEAFLRRDGAAIWEALDESVEIYQTPLLPWGGSRRGIDGARAFFAALLAHVDSRVAVERYIEAGDAVVVVGRTRGIVLATRRAFDVPIAHVWTVKDGRAARWEAYIDTPAMLEALAP